MTVGRIITLSALFAQVLSAPNGCIESCTSYHRQESYRSHHASGGSEGSVQGSISPENLNLDFSRPGNWTEHNEYRTDGGHGRVHEEQGQYVNGPKKVRFYKKNYTSAYSSGTNGAGYEGSGQLNTDNTYSSQLAGGQHYYGSQNTYDQSRHEYGYNRVHNEGLQSSSRRVNTHSERLEDFGEYGSSSQVEHGTQDQHRYNQRPGTWSKVDSYKTDGGRGQVFEEQGQYVTGPKTVRYFKKNYTSSYSSGGPIPEIGAIRSENINKELQKLHEEFNREVQKISNTEHVNTLNRANLVQQGTTGFGSEIQSIDYRPRVPTAGPTYVYPETSQSNYGSESHSSYESQQTHVSTTNPKPQPHLIRIPLYRRTHDTSTAQEAERLNHNAYDEQGSTYSRPGQVRRYEERWSSSSHTRESVPSVDVQTEQIGSSQYRNQHSGHHSSYTTHGHNTYVGQSAENNFNSAYRPIPSQAVVGTLDLGQVSQSSVDCTQETAGQVQYGSQHIKRYRREAGDNQQHQENQDLEQLSQLTQSEQLTQQNEDQSHDQLHQQETQNEDFGQETGHIEFGQQTQESQKPEKITDQENEDSQQHTSGGIELQSEKNDDLEQQQSGDLTQQTGDDFIHQTGGLELGQHSQQTGGLELGQQTGDDFTQQTGGLEFGQHTGEDFTQQTGGLEFGQHTQQSEDMTQQVSLRRKRQIVNPYYVDEDLKQQAGGFDEFMQQMGSLGFEQEMHKPYNGRIPSVGNQHLETFNQENEDLAQHTGGFDDFSQQTGHLEFGQQPQKPFKPERPPVGNQHSDLTQQNEDLSQQTGGFDDFSQQTGHLEFGQQPQRPFKPERPPVGNQHLDLTQQNEDLTQQTGGFDDFSQQTGHLELGQQTQSPYKPNKPPVYDQHLRDFTQQNEDLTQQTDGFDDFSQQVGKLEYGQQTQSRYMPRKPPTRDQQLGDFTQQNQDLSQQTGGFDDFSQQTGHFEFGQETQNPYKPTLLPVGNQHIGDFSQQTDQVPAVELLPNNERNKPFGQNSPKTNDDDVPGVIGLTTESSQIKQQTEADDMEQIDQNHHPTPSTQKSAPKPTPRPRFYDLKPLQFGVSSEAETTVNPYDQTVSQNIERNPRQRYYPQGNDEGTDIAPQSGQSNTYPWKVDTNSGSKAVEVTNEADVDEEKRDTSRGDQNPQSSDNLTTTPKPASNPDDSRRFTKTGRRFGQRRQHFYHVNWPKADDAGAIQWHMLNQPSDLSNSEGQYTHVQQSHQQSMRHHSSQMYYGQNYQEQNRDVQQQSEPVYYKENMQHVQSAQGMDIRDPYHQESSQQRQTYYNNNGQQQGWYEQSQVYKSNDRNQEQVPNQVQSSYVNPDQIGGTQTNSPIDIEPRFIEVYGGKGPYDATHKQDIFDKVTANPSATFAPNREGPDSWEIREKPEETYILRRTTTTEPTTTEEESHTTTAAPQNFWQRVGSSLTNSYGKARDKAREIFG